MAEAFSDIQRLLLYVTKRVFFFFFRICFPYDTFEQDERLAYVTAEAANKHALSLVSKYGRMQDIHSLPSAS